MKKLYRNRETGIIAGILSGFADYFGVDVTLLRVIFIFFVLVTGFFPGVIAYIIAIFIMPVKPPVVIHDVPPTQTESKTE